LLTGPKMVTSSPLKKDRKYIFYKKLKMGGQEVNWTMVPKDSIQRILYRYAVVFLDKHKTNFNFVCPYRRTLLYNISHIGNLYDMRYLRYDIAGFRAVSSLRLIIFDFLSLERHIKIYWKLFGLFRQNFLRSCFPSNYYLLIICAILFWNFLTIF